MIKAGSPTPHSLAWKKKNMTSRLLIFFIDGFEREERRGRKGRKGGRERRRKGRRKGGKERGREEEKLIYCSTYLIIHWLILIYALTK